MATTPISALPSGQAIGGTTVNFKNTTAHGAVYDLKSTEELVTLSTSGVTTNLSFQLPALARIVHVVARVTTSITTATSWGFGVLSESDLTSFTGATVTSVTAGQTAAFFGSDITGGPKTLRVTCNTTPGAGAIRFVIFYEQLTAPTS